MWWAGSKSGRSRVAWADVYLGTRRLAVCRGNETVVFESVREMEEGLAALRAWLTTCPPKQALRAWLSGGLCRPFPLPVIAGVQNATELHRVAMSMASQQTGLGGDSRLWIDRGRRDESQVCVVVQTKTLDRLLDVVAAAQGCKLLSIRPWWAEVLRHGLTQEPAPLTIATQDCDSLTVFSGRGGNFDIATTMTPVLDRDAADDALTRVLMSGGGEGDRRMLARLAIQREIPAKSASGFALAGLAELSQ